MDLDSTISQPPKTITSHCATSKRQLTLIRNSLITPIKPSILITQNRAEKVRVGRRIRHGPIESDRVVFEPDGGGCGIEDRDGGCSLSVSFSVA